MVQQLLGQIFVEEEVIVTLGTRTGFTITLVLPAALVQLFTVTITL